MHFFIRRFTKLGHPEIDFVDAGRVVVHPETFEVRGGGGQVMGVRRQLPLQLAWAISIHKVVWCGCCVKTSPGPSDDTSDKSPPPPSPATCCL